MEITELRADALQARHARHEQSFEELLAQLEKAEGRERDLEARVRTLEAGSREPSAPARALRALRNLRRP